MQDTLATLAWLAQDPVRGARTGQSPHAILHRQNKAALRYFPPQGAARHRPVLVSMPLINTWNIFDLLPGKSVVERLVQAGVPVYLLDWGRPGPEDQALPFAWHTDEALPRAFDRASRHARAAGHPGDGELDAIGYCVGGTVLAVSLARHPGLARRMALLAAPIDFHQSGRLKTWADPATFPLDAIIDGHGNFPRALMRASFAWLRPMGQLSKYRSLQDRIDDPSFRETWAAMEQWSGDNVDFPGETYREYVRRCYFDNALITGGWDLAGTPVDLSQAGIPALALAAQSDHICPPAAAHALAKVWGGPVQTQTLKGGHVGVCIGRALPEALLRWIGEGQG